MRAILYNFKYILLLSLFNIFLSLYINKDNLDLQNTIIDNRLTYIDLQKNQNINLSIPYENDKDLLLSIKSFNNKTFSFSSDNEFINNNNNIKEYRQTINSSKLNNENKTLIININSNDDDNNIEIINIVNYSNISKYHLIQKDNEKNTVYSPNFVRFFQSNENDVKVEIKFNNEIHESLYYGRVKLSTNDTNYIPRVFNLNKNLYNYMEKDFTGKDITIKIDDSIEGGPKGNKDCEIIAFIFSIKTNTNIQYSVTSIKEEMNWFLIGSIILALIFAVITFFLIRRKKNVNETNEEEGEYNVNKQDEGEGEGENPN